VGVVLDWKIVEGEVAGVNKVGESEAIALFVGYYRRAAQNLEVRVLIIQGEADKRQKLRAS